MIGQMVDPSRAQACIHRRTSLGFSVRKMADETGVSRESITKIERGDPSVDQFTIDRYLSALDRMENRLGVTDPEHVVNLIELPDGTKVTFTGTSANVAASAAAFLANRGI